MTYEPALTAIADPTRRAIIDRLRPGPMTVTKIAEPLPVSRPAVSQHLKILKKAGMVTVEKQGTKNLYALAPSGLDTLRAWMELLWSDSLESFARGAADQAKNKTGMAPVTKALHVRLDQDEAFKLLTEDIALWWPVSTHSVSAQEGALPMAVIMQTRAGGQIIETMMDGSQSAWATVTEWNPPFSMELDWHVGTKQIDATRVRLRVDPAGRGAKITLIHDAWEKLGKDAHDKREEYQSGWDHVLLDRFGAAAAASLSNFSTNL